MNARVNLQAPTKINLLGMTRQDLEAFFTDMGEKAFRASQLMKWIHHFMVEDVDQMTNISKTLRDRLKAVAEIKPLTVAVDQLSADGTRKWLFELEDGNRVETVYIPENDRGTLCISSQVGCALDCSFCSTARQGFSRNLSSAEIVAQVWLAVKLLGKENSITRKVTNIVLMGMGEPLLNYDNVIKATSIFMDDFAYMISKRRVTLSTAGVVPKIDQMAGDTDIQLAVSLHAINDEIRDGLVPLNKKYPLNELMAACRRYVKKQHVKTKITFEYVMLDGVNDRPQDARQMIHLLKGIPSKINLIPFNPFPGSGYQSSKPEAVEHFKDLLKKAGMVATIRKTRGEDIDAACGQLVGQVEDKSRRHRRFEEPRYGMN